MINVDNNLTDREMYKLEDGIMHEHFKGFEFKWGSNRIYCAKVTKAGEYQQETYKLISEQKYVKKTNISGLCGMTSRATTSTTLKGGTL